MTGAEIGRFKSGHSTAQATWAADNGAFCIGHGLLIMPDAQRAMKIEGRR